MKYLRRKISVFILAFAVLGLFTSLMHYHSYTLDCLEHEGEAHYTEYELVCPVCALHVQVDTNNSAPFFTDLEFREYTILLNDTLPLQEKYNPPLGRSPPHIA